MVTSCITVSTLALSAITISASASLIFTTAPTRISANKVFNFAPSIPLLFKYFTTLFSFLSLAALFFSFCFSLSASLMRLLITGCSKASLINTMYWFGIIPSLLLSTSLCCLHPPIAAASNKYNKIFFIIKRLSVNKIRLLLKWNSLHGVPVINKKWDFKT